MRRFDAVLALENYLWVEMWSCDVRFKSHTREKKKELKIEWYKNKHRQKHK